MTLATVWLAIWLILAVQVPLILVVTRYPSREEATIARALWLRQMTHTAVRHAHATSTFRRWKAAWPEVAAWRADAAAVAWPDLRSDL